MKIEMEESLVKLFGRNILNPETKLIYFNDLDSNPPKSIIETSFKVYLTNFSSIFLFVKNNEIDENTLARLPLIYISPFGEDCIFSFVRIFGIVNDYLVLIFRPVEYPISEFAFRKNKNR